MKEFRPTGRQERLDLLDALRCAALSGEKLLIEMRPHNSQEAI
jgi:hypothetical protein